MRSPALASSVAALLVAFAVAGAVGCSSADPTPIASGRKTTPTPTPADTTKNPKDDLPAPAPVTPAPTPGAEIGTETWADGKSIAASVTIKAGATVDITPSANVTVATGASITVKGTLSVKAGAAGAAHAKLDGMNWAGIIVASGGTLTVDSLDISNSSVGVWTQTGNLDATLLNSSILNSGTPIKMEAGSKLSITKSKVTATGPSAIAGTFVASYLAYDKGTSEGLELSDPLGSMTISDSTLTGQGGGDYVVSRAGKLVKVEYSTITGSHCSLHFNAVDNFIIDHVSLDVNSYSAMLYGSGAGPNQILSSNVRAAPNGTNLDFSGTNGVTTIDKNFINAIPNSALPTGTKITNPASVAIVNAKPR